MSKIIIGDIELSGFFPPCGLLTISILFLNGRNEKSVNWLFKRNPFKNKRDPKLFSILDVILITFPELSTIEKCDLILVLNSGKVIEYGTHKKLCEINGYYKETYDKQKTKK